MRISGQSILARPATRRACRTAATRRRSRASTRAGRRACSATTIPNLLIDHAMRNPPVPPGFWRGVNNNQNAHLSRMLHGRAGACGRPGSARVPPQAAGEQPEASRRAERRRREGAAGASRAPQGVYRGLAQHMGYGSYVAACAEVSVSDKGELKIHRIVAATDLRPCRQPAADRGAGRGLVRLRPVGAALRRDHAQGRPRRAGELRHLSGDADGRDAEGRDRSSCRRAASGAASASRRSSWRRRRCSTRSSRRPASASARMPLKHADLRKA